MAGCARWGEIMGRAREIPGDGWYPQVPTVLSKRMLYGFVLGVAPHTCVRVRAPLAASGGSHVLPKFSDGWSHLYVEQCRVDQEARTIAIHDQTGKIPVPCANLTLLVLGWGIIVPARVRVNRLLPSP